MSLTAGSISLTSKTATSALLAVTSASGSTAPYANQWYRSLSSGFTPGAGNIISGATALTLSDTGLSPGTTYYYKVVQTDALAASVTTTQLAVPTLASLQNPNQFAQSPVPGMPALLPSQTTISVTIDSAQAGLLVAGQFVKLVDSAGPSPKVLACDADADEALGALYYNIKNASFAANMQAEVAIDGSCIWLYASEAIPRGAQVVLSTATAASVAAASGHTGSNIVGWAYDKATVAGQLIRVMISSPSFVFAP